jgi:hypothetical protein
MATLSSLTAKDAENLLHAAQIPSGRFAKLRDQYEQSLQLLGAGWHGPTDIKTLEGLEGQFLWPEDFFSVQVISFVFDPDKIGFQGKYKLMNGLAVVEQGVFYSVPNNPAIGFAAITLAPAGNAAARTSIVSGIFTDNAWRIYTALLNKLEADGPAQVPFSAVRVG